MDYVALLEGKIGEGEAGRKIGEKIDSFSGLLSRDAAAKIISSEMGLIEREVSGIGSLREGMGSVDLRVKVEGIGELRSFPSGALLRTVTVSDSSGEGEVNFWAEDAKKAGKMHLLDTLEIRKGYVKMGRVNIGYKTTYSVAEGAQVFSVSDILGGGAGEGKKFSVMGKVVRIEGMREGGRAFVFAIGEGNGGDGGDAGGGGKEIPVSLLNTPLKGEHLRVGDSVLLEGVEYNGAEILIEGRARMLLRKNRGDIYRGELKGIEAGGSGEGGGVLLMESGERFEIGKEELIKFLNLKGLREDMDIGMLVKMKEPSLLGRRVVLKFRSAGGKEIESAQAR